MQIVIDIPEEMMLYINKNEFNAISEAAYGSMAMLAIHNGTPLPKGHRGRGMKRTYEAVFFNGKCPYTDKPCNEWKCSTCEIDAQEKKDAEELDRAESEETE